MTIYCVTFLLLIGACTLIEGSQNSEMTGVDNKHNSLLEGTRKMILR